MRKHIFTAFIGMLICIAMLFCFGCTPTENREGNEVGDVCYDFTVSAYNDDGEFTLSAHRGKIAVINFWATWCDPCVKEMPYFQRLTEEYENVEVAAIHITTVTDDVQQWLDERNWGDYNIVFAQDSEDIADGGIYGKLGGKDSVPATIIVDKEGVIRFVRFGSVDYETLCAQVELILQNENNKDGEITYSIYLSCEDTLIFGALDVELRKEDGSVADRKPAVSGIMSFTLDKGVYTAVLVEKAGFEGTLSDYVYTIPTLTETARSAQIEILPKSTTEETIEYKVIVKKPDGSTVSGVSVQLCGGPSYVCNFAVTDDNGVAVFNLVAGNYEVHIDQKIEGFIFDNTAYTMGNEGGELEVFLQTTN